MIANQNAIVKNLNQKLSDNDDTSWSASVRKLGSNTTCKIRVGRWVVINLGGRLGQSIVSSLETASRGWE